MSDVTNREDGPFSGRVAGLAAAIVVVFFGAIVALVAWAPELSNREVAGQHAYSKSAAGYGGLIDLLNATGVKATVSRRESRLTEGDGRLLILAPGNRLSGDRFDLGAIPEPALIILPKWDSEPDPFNRAWEDQTILLSETVVSLWAADLADDLEIWRIRTPAEFDTPFGARSPRLGEDLQVLRSDEFEPVVSTAAGALLARYPNRSVYVLADPDLINNVGLADRETARTALDLIQWLDDDWIDIDDVVFDATLQGFVRSESLLRLVVDIPFIGATVIALMTAAMLVWAASVRFGSPQKAAPALQPGKAALADSTAGLLGMARREPRLAPAYARLMRTAAAKSAGAPASLEDTALSDVLDKRSKGRWMPAEAALSKPAASKEQLVRRARALFEARQEIEHAD